MTTYQQRKIHTFIIFFLIVPILIMVSFCAGCTKEPEMRDVKLLVVHSFKKNLVSYSDMNRMIIEDMKQKGFNPEIEFFYLNSDALGAEEELTVFNQYLNTMKTKPEIILTTDDPATYSLLACRHPFLKKVPIVFIGVNFPNWELLKEYPNVTGIWDKPNYLANVEMIENLMGYQRIRFYYDRTYIGRKILGELAEQLKDKDKKLNKMIGDFLQQPDAERIPKMECGDFFGKGESLTSELKSTEFYFQNLRDELGGTILWYINGTFERSVSLLTRYDYTISRIGNMATIPTFTTVGKELGYGQGILGGNLMTLEEQVKEGCDYLAQILNGTAISSLPIKKGRKTSVLDWKEMQRWGIEKSAVEKEYQIINMPFYVEYQTELIIVCTLTGLLIVFIICYLLFLLIRESKRKRLAQQNLREEKEFLSLVLEGGNIFAWGYEHTGEQFVFDKEFAIGIGLNSEKITLNELVHITHPDDVESAINQIISVVNRQEEKASVRARIDFNDNGYIWYEFRMLGLPGRKNSTISAVGSIMCIQNIKEHEEELIIARDLAAKTELKQSFLANMSHEIRTPLNAIVGFSNILVMDESIEEEEKKEFITSINTNCELLLKLINDILEISRIESGNMSFLFDLCSVNKIVEDIYQMNYLTVSSSVSFITELLPEDVIVTTDSGRLKQILANFVNNALKFTYTGHIKVGATLDKDKNEICLYVEDTGIGISVEEQRMIFERFYKCDEFSQGTGLGLSISSVIAEKLNGKITIKSEVGKGSRFGMTIPYEAQQPEEESQKIECVTLPPKSFPAENRPVVLIVEDSVSNYMLLSRILKEHFTIVWALNGRDALDIVNKQLIDLVLMDIKMQEMDGITALKKIRKVYKNLPVIIQSAYAYEENRVQAKKAGCTDFIEKPIHADLLMEAIGKCIPISGYTGITTSK